MKTTLKITGMTCDNCVKHAREALEAVPGVQSAEVDLATGLAIVEGEADVKALIGAVEEEGYEAVTDR
jgi:copper chaperone